MLFKHKLKTGLKKNKPATIFVLSSILVCLSMNTPTMADGFYYFEPIPTPIKKLARPIYLDVSQAEKVIPKASTTIPFNLRQFSEEDYFSSAIDDTPTISQEKQQKFRDFPSPSEYKPVKNVVVEKPLLEDITVAEEQEFAPTYNATNFFSPLPDVPEIEESKVVSETTNQIFADNSSTVDSTYFASTVSEQDDNSDFEGMKISSIKIKGLRTLQEDNILSQIDTQEGSVFNSSILQRDLQKIYSAGYFTDNMSVEPMLQDDETIELTFSVEENIIITDVLITGNSVIPTSDLMSFVLPMKSKPQNLNLINKAIENINSFYHEKGYILANVASVDDDVDGNLSFNIQEGLINKIKISGNERTKDYVIERNIMTQAGTVYNEEFLKKDLAKVFSTQIFEEVNREINPSQENEGAYDVTVVVKEKVTNNIALGGGIDTGLGAFGSVSFNEDNFLGKAQRVSLSGILGSGILLSDASIKNHMNYHVELSFFEPYFINADNSLMSKIYYRELGSFNVPLAIERRIGAMAGVEHKFKNNEHLSASFMLGAEHIRLKEGDYDRISRLYNIHKLNIADRASQLRGGFFLNLSPGLKYSNLDNIENPREGIITQARFTEAIGVSNIHHTNGRLSGMVTRFFPVFKKSSFSLTAKAGVKVHGDNMPEIMAYRLGGPYTIRGYRMSGVGTGESFLMGSAELATPIPFVDRLKWDFIKKMRLTFFVDAGKVFDPTITNILYDRPEHAITAGIGLRLHVPGIGPISVDYGLPITNPGRFGSEHGYFTFGTGGLNGLYGY